MVERLVCPVRACAAPLSWEEAGCACPRGHRFDRARSGYVNLLQPQDRRAREPGDSREAIAARRRTLERGLGEPLLEALLDVLRAAPPRPGDALLDAGCGEGTFLDGCAGALDLEGWGVDLSARAIDLAARRHPGRRWIVANADRRLPFADGSFAVVLSIAARKNGPEFARLLAPAGRVVVAVPGEDDLLEVREALFGRALRKDRGARARELLGDALALEGERAVRARARLPRAAVADLLSAAYRGARHREQARLAALPDEMDVTSSSRLLWFRRA